MATERTRQGRKAPVQAGETFGLLTVLGEADRRDARGNKYLRARCECGTETVVLGGNLRQGRTSSCGDRKHAKPRTDPIARMAPGERHGRLVAVERVGATDAGAALWLCRCDCGGEKTAVAGELRSGRTISCGCIKRAGFTEVDYGGAHARVKRSRGKASRHACVDCGGVAAEWSLAKHRIDPVHIHWQVVKFQDGLDREVPYSRDPDHYEPRCRACHLVYDRADRGPDGKFVDAR